jgi:carbon storage regulator
MLILTRRPNESFAIGENVVVWVLGIRGGQVSIGIDAPRDVRILRDNAKVRTDAVNAAIDEVVR